MPHTEFTVLTGHLKEFPLSDVVGILRHGRRTGRLLIEYPIEPVVLFFKDGNLVDAHTGTLKGIHAAMAAINQQPDAAFTFNPLIAPTAYSINDYWQKVVLEMLGCLETLGCPNSEGVSEPHVAAHSRPLKIQEPVVSNKPVLIPSLSLPPVIKNIKALSNSNRIRIFAVTLLLLLVASSSVMFMTRSKISTNAPPTKDGETRNETQKPVPSENILSLSGFASSDASEIASGDEQTEEVKPSQHKIKQKWRTPLAKKYEGVAIDSTEQTQTSLSSDTNTKATTSASNTSPTKKDVSPSDATITIITQVENGRVVQSQVANPRPGMEAFEASALRAARQQRYSPDTKGSKKVQIKISKQ